jgi:hypothetical protein
MALARQAKQELQAHNDHKKESSSKKGVVKVKALPSREEAKELLKLFLLHGGNYYSLLSLYYPTLGSGMVKNLAKLGELTIDNHCQPKKVNCGVVQGFIMNPWCGQQGSAMVATGHGNGQVSLRL